jgi:uncharacterized LabA/DUF88 family protein
MAVDIVRLSCGRMISKAIVVKGDSDFVQAIEASKESRVVAILFYSPSSINDELLLFVDESVIILADLIKLVERLS